MTKTAVISTRIEPDLKNDVNTILGRLGLSATEAVTLFYKMVKRENGLPFKTEIPDQKTKNKQTAENSWLGCLENFTEIHGDIVSPVMDENQWDVLAK